MQVYISRNGQVTRFPLSYKSKKNSTDLFDFRIGRVKRRLSSSLCVITEKLGGRGGIGYRNSVIRNQSMRLCIFVSRFRSQFQNYCSLSLYLVFPTELVLLRCVHKEAHLCLFKLISIMRVFPAFL